jgi:hypothetical protein
MEMDAQTMTYLLPLLAAALGIAMGVLHFATLERVTRLYLKGGSVGQAVALQVARLGLVTAFFVGLALLGAKPLLAGALGLLIGRAIVLRRKREAT